MEFSVWGRTWSIRPSSNSSTTPFEITHSSFACVPGYIMHLVFQKIAERRKWPASAERLVPSSWIQGTSGPIHLQGLAGCDGHILGLRLSQAWAIGNCCCIALWVDAFRACFSTCSKATAVFNRVSVQRLLFYLMATGVRDGSGQ